MTLCACDLPSFCAPGETVRPVCEKFTPEECSRFCSYCEHAEECHKEKES